MDCRIPPLSTRLAGCVRPECTNGVCGNWDGDSDFLLVKMSTVLACCFRVFLVSFNLSPGGFSITSGFPVILLSSLILLMQVPFRFLDLYPFKSRLSIYKPDKNPILQGWPSLSLHSTLEVVIIPAPGSGLPTAPRSSSQQSRKLFGTDNLNIFHCQLHHNPIVSHTRHYDYAIQRPEGSRTTGDC